MPEEVVLRNSDESVLPIIGTVNPDGTVVPNLGDSGWRIDLDTDPEVARREIARRELEASASPVERPVPHFAAAPEPPTVPPTEPESVPEPPADSQPGTDEQGDTSLDLTKEK